MVGPVDCVRVAGKITQLALLPEKRDVSIEEGKMYRGIGLGGDDFGGFADEPGTGGMSD